MSNVTPGPSSIHYLFFISGFLEEEEEEEEEEREEKKGMELEVGEVEH